MQAAKTVQEFLRAWSRPDGWRNAFVDYFSPDCVYENVGLSKTIGPDEAITFVLAFESKLPFVTMTVDVRTILESGGVVMTERIDRFHDAQGTEIFSLPVMGVFEVVQGKIAAWRDYFDASSFRTQPV
jgi:limonene-1,2-epoxide hydrolase